jgi:uncharacterized oligopeptide transporter (OPT) family protein
VNARGARQAIDDLSDAIERILVGAGVLLGIPVAIAMIVVAAFARTVWAGVQRGWSG